MNNKFLQIVGIIGFLFTIVAIFMALPTWIIILAVTFTTIIHLYYVPDIGQDEADGDAVFNDDKKEEDLFAPDKLLRIKEQYEQKIRSIEIEKDNVIENLKIELDSFKKQSEDDITAVRENADKEIEIAKKEAKDMADAKSASLLPLLPGSAERPVRINMTEFTKKCVAEFDKESKMAGIHINVAGSDEDLYIRASVKMLRVLFRDIIDNALKYMKKKGTLQITVANLDDDIFIAMKDNGEGLAENETTHIFELNYQGSNRISGNGLGLAQAKAIVEYYGGMIYAKSALGRGMGIYIHLPAEKEDA